MVDDNWGHVSRSDASQVSVDVQHELEARALIGLAGAGNDNH